MQTVESVRAEVAPGIHRSRWGYHPCDYPTFLLLRKLFKQYMRALTGYHAWLRWQRKQPQNRVLRRTLRDAAGKKIGREVVGPRPEPALCPLFVVREMVTVKWHNGEYHKDGVQVERVRLDDRGVADALWRCRPVGSQEAVRKLALTPERIRELAARLPG